MTPKAEFIKEITDKFNYTKKLNFEKKHAISKVKDKLGKYMSYMYARKKIALIYKFLFFFFYSY